VSEPLLRVTGLRTWFDTEVGPARAVDGLSLHVEAGEAVGLVGESGCGKTVTALSLLGLLPSPPARVAPGSSIRFRDEELVGAPASVLRRIRGDELAMVFQEPDAALNPVYTVGEQVAEVLRSHRRMGAREAREAAARTLGEVGLPDAARRLDAYPHQLSGGMRQRVVLAMALACRPALLVADEPTTALDVTVQAQILELVDRLRRDRRMALLLITHDLGVVAEVCDRVLVMYAGRIVEEGEVAEVFRAPRHPYTRGLLDSLPRVEEPGRRLRPIAGGVPPATAWPDGCRFRPRCPFARPACAADQELQAVSPPGHAVRCGRTRELGPLGGAA
jgi:oligopeptide/dipeptide ABC transporter ATP-binding protein